MRRKKANMLDLPEFFKSERVVSLDGERKGYRYLLSERLTDEERKHLETFKNVVFGTVSYRYAPEVVHDTIILTDKIY